jgi:hypothetical protein
MNQPKIQRTQLNPARPDPAQPVATLPVATLSQGPMAPLGQARGLLDDIHLH